jgi:hypothetical protein
VKPWSARSGRGSGQRSENRVGQDLRAMGRRQVGLSVSLLRVFWVWPWGPLPVRQGDGRLRELMAQGAHPFVLAASCRFPPRRLRSRRMGCTSPARQDAGRRKRWWRGRDEGQSGTSSKTAIGAVDGYWKDRLWMAAGSMPLICANSPPVARCSHWARVEGIMYA